MNIKDQIRKSFRVYKRRDKNGLVSSIWIYPFKMKSGAIISTQPWFNGLCHRDKDYINNYINMLDYRVLTEGAILEPMDIQVKTGEKVKNYNFDSSCELLSLFKDHGGIEND